MTDREPRESHREEERQFEKGVGCHDEAWTRPGPGLIFLIFVVVVLVLVRVRVHVRVGSG
jgi:hypothetical protein